MPVQVLAFPRLREATTAPEVGEMVRLPSAFETDDTAPPPEEIHVPFIAKQPAVMLKPFAAVVEPVFETENSVVVAEAVEEPIAKSVVLVEPSLPCTESCAYGDVEAIPMFPPFGLMIVFDWSTVPISLMTSWLFPKPS